MDGKERELRGTSNRAVMTQKQRNPVINISPIAAQQRHLLSWHKKRLSPNLVKTLVFQVRVRGFEPPRP